MEYKRRRRREPQAPAASRCCHGGWIFLLWCLSSHYDTVVLVASFCRPMPQSRISKRKIEPSATTNVVGKLFDLHEDDDQASRDESPQNEVTTQHDHHCFNRRAALAAFSSSLLLVPTIVAAETGSTLLESVSVGRGEWVAATSSKTIADNAPMQNIPASFCTYLTRFLIQYDEAVAEWWKSQQEQVSLLSTTEQQSKLGRSFGSMAKSIEEAIDQQLQQHDDVVTTTAQSSVLVFSQLYKSLEKSYGSQPDAMRQLSLLFALLPPTAQPTNTVKLSTTTSTISRPQELRDSSSSYNNNDGAKLKLALDQDFCMLLPDPYDAVQVTRKTNSGDNTMLQIQPPIPLFEVGIGEEFGQTATATLFGPMALKPLLRERPVYGWPTYALFGLSGATGCALTHTVVIPLDVVKTKAQTDPDVFANKSVVAAGQQIWQRDGWRGLLLGSQATVAGYFWYGLSVYPSYAFFKRFLTNSLSPPVALAHVNDIALVAGALAAVVASLGLTPLEAARIRAVAEPAKYQPLGLSGTLAVIAEEDPMAGWKALYAGLPSLLTRQVIFGSVKFLAFERACEFIFGAAPFLRDATWTSLLVSLVAGGFSGALSSVVSQPADSVLTYVAKNSEKEGNSNVGVLESSRIMIEQEGMESLFRGLGSRCVWAGSIIAGQFLLYDVFRTYFHVTQEDLSQVFRIILPESA